MNLINTKAADGLSRDERIRQDFSDDLRRLSQVSPMEAESIKSTLTKLNLAPPLMSKAGDVL